MLLLTAIVGLICSLLLRSGGLMAPSIQVMCTVAWGHIFLMSLATLLTWKTAFLTMTEVSLILGLKKVAIIVLTPGSTTLVIVFNASTGNNLNN